MSKQKQKARKQTAEEIMLANTGRWQDRIAEALVVLLLCVQPLYFHNAGGAGYVNLTGKKFQFFTVCMVLAILAVIAVWFYQKAGGLAPQPGAKLSIADWALLGFAAVTLLSALFSPYKWVPVSEATGYGEQLFTKAGANVWWGVSERFDGAVTQLFYVAAFFIISRWYKPRERDLVIFSVSALLISLIGILQFHGMDIFNLWPNGVEGLERYWVEDYYDIHFRATLGNVDIVSTYVCIAVLLCGFLFIRTASKWKYVFLAGSGMSFWLMVLGGAYSGMAGALLAVFFALPFIIESRAHLGRFLILGAAWSGAFTLHKLLYNAAVLKESAATAGIFAAAALALTAGGLFLTVFWKEKEAGAEAPVKWKLGVIMIAAVVITGLAGVEFLGRRENGPDSYKDALYQVREIMHGNIADEFATNRVYIWRTALNEVSKNPLIGSGPDTFMYVFPDEAQMLYGEPYDKAHNEYVQILICQGILGLLAYLVFLGALLLRSVKKAFREPLLMAVLAAFFGYCVQAFFNISLPIASQMLWVLAGIMAALTAAKRRRPAE